VTRINRFNAKTDEQDEKDAKHDVAEGE